MVTVLVVLMVLVVFSIILPGKLLGQMFAKMFNCFLKINLGSPWNEQ